MSNRYLRPGALVGHVVVLAAALTCLRLGWWQWNVFERVGGTGQNLGYALLWPVFAGSFIYMWLRFLHLEGVRHSEVSLYVDEEPVDEAVRAEPAPAEAEPEVRQRRAAHETFTVGLGYIPADDDEDPELAAYNRALAELAEEDERRA